MFHLLNAFVCILRCVVFALRDKVRVSMCGPEALSSVLIMHMSDAPCLPACILPKAVCFVTKNLRPDQVLRAMLSQACAHASGLSEVCAD